MLQFDIPTLSASMALVQLASVIFSVILYASRQTFRGAPLWITGQVLVAIGGIGLAFRWSMPWLVALAFSNIPYLAAPIVFIHSLWVFRSSRRFPRWIYLAIPVAVGLLAIDLSPDIRFRVAVFSTFSTVFNLGAFVLAVYRQPPHYRLPAYLLGFTFLVMAIVHLLRLPAVLVSHPVMFEDQGRVGSIAYFLALLSAFFILFGYYLLSSVRFEKQKLARERMLSDQNRKLKNLNDTMTLVLSVVGHDVKIPLRSAARYVQRFLAKNPENVEERREGLLVIEQTLANSDRLLENLLLFAKARLAENPPECAGVSIREVVTTAVDVLRPEIESKNIDLDVQVAENLSLVNSEETSLAIIVRNILSNAIKFSPTAARLVIQISQNADYTVLKITDNGVGMSAEARERILRSDAPRSTQGTHGERGYGIGLALVRALAVQLGIGFGLTSEEGEGTEVRLEIPVSATRSSAEKDSKFLEMES